MVDLSFFPGISSRDKAVQYLLDNKAKFFEKFANDTLCPSEKENSAISIFMAGAPGAGKTEYSKSLINETGIHVVRIDADEIRTFFPWYTGTNADDVQQGAFRGVDKLYDYVLKKRKNVIIDSTFTPISQVEKNVQRSLDKGREVKIYYLYQDAIVSWEFTKIRSIEEGRTVPKEMFIDALFESLENVKKIREKFGPKVGLVMIRKDYTKDESGSFKMSINQIDENLVIPYNKEELNQLLT